jgi:hypothetical protein
MTRDPRAIVRAGKWLALAALGCFADAGYPQLSAANGAFADSKVILLPKARPQQIIASADVSGLVISDDAGGSWYWICEDAIGSFSALFQLGAAPDERLYAIARQGLVASSDSGCTWSHPEGIAQHAGDVFADPVDPARVLIVSQTALSDGPELSDVVAESSDYGESFGAPQFTTDSASITGVEVSRTDAASRYLTMSSLASQHPYVVRSTDRGATWRPIDLSHQLGLQPYTLRILAVDPDDARSLYLRMSNGARDSLGISRDGADTLRVALQLEARMTAFLRRSDGALLVAGSDGQSYISQDGGETFSAWPVTLHITALAERDGRLYANANSKLDGFALGVSTDGGMHWQALLDLAELSGPLPCGSIAQVCAASWTQLMAALGSARPALSISEADAGVPIAMPLVQPPAPAASSRAGSGCSMIRTRSASATPWIALVFVASYGWRRRTRRALASTTHARGCP